MGRLLGQVGNSVIGWIGALAGVIWRGAELAHNAEYLNSIVLEHLDVQAVAAVLFGHPSVALVVAGSVWIWYSKRTHKSSRDVLVTGSQRIAPPQLTVPLFKQPVAPALPLWEAPKQTECNEVVVRERIIEREIVYRRVVK